MALESEDPGRRAGPVRPFPKRDQQRVRARLRLSPRPRHSTRLTFSSFVSVTLLVFCATFVHCT